MKSSSDEKHWKTRKKTENVNNSNHVNETSKEEEGVPIIINSGLIVDVVDVDSTRVLFLQHVSKTCQQSREMTLPVRRRSWESVWKSSPGLRRGVSCRFNLPVPEYREEPLFCYSYFILRKLDVVRCRVYFSWTSCPLPVGKGHQDLVTLLLRVSKWVCGNITLGKSSNLAGSKERADPLIPSTKW